MTELVQP